MALINSTRESPLFYAAMGGRIGAIEVLMRAGAKKDVNYRGYDGVTPLCVAAERGFLDTVACLLHHGASLQQRDDHGYDAFGYSMRDLHDEEEHNDGRYVPGFSGPDIPDEDRLETARLLQRVRLAGGWRRYVDEPRWKLALLRELCSRGRATPPPLRYNAFDAALPTDCFFHVLKFWRSDYGAASYLEPSPSRSDLLRAFYEDEHEEDSEEEDY